MLVLLLLNAVFALQATQSNSINEELVYKDASPEVQFFQLSLDVAPTAETTVELESEAFLFCNKQKKITFTFHSDNTPQQVVLTAIPLPKTKSQDCPLAADGAIANSTITATESALDTQITSVIVIKRTIGNSGVCSSTGDPHFWSLDRKKFHSQKLGFHTLVKSEYFNVQSHHKACGKKPGRVTCNDGFAIQYKGDKLFLVGKELHFFSTSNPAYSIPAGQRKSYLDYMTLIVEGNLYSLTIVDGSNYVKALFSSNGMKKLELSASFRGQVSGMCGDFDGNPSNDGQTVPTVPADNLFYNCEIPLDNFKVEVAPENIKKELCDIQYQNLKCSSTIQIPQGFRLMKRNLDTSTKRVASNANIFKREASEDVEEILANNDQVVIEACKIVLGKCTLPDQLESLYEDCVQDAGEEGDMTIIGEYESLAQIACYEEIKGLQILASTSIILEIDDNDGPEDSETDFAEQEFYELESGTIILLASDFGVEELEETEVEVDSVDDSESSEDESESSEDEESENEDTTDLTKRDLSDTEVMIELKKRDGIERGTKHKNDPFTVAANALFQEDRLQALDLVKEYKAQFILLRTAEKNRLSIMRELGKVIMAIEKNPTDILVEKKINQELLLQDVHVNVTGLLEELAANQLSFLAAAVSALDSFDNRTSVYAEFTEHQREITRFKWDQKLNKTQENRIRVIARYNSQIEKANSTKIALLEQVSTEKIEEKIVKFDKKMAKIIQRRDKWAVKQEKNVIKFKDNISKNETKFAARVKKTSENNVRWSNKFHNSMKKREARTNKWGTNVQDKASKYLRKLEKNITRFRAQLVNQDKCLTKIERNEQIAQIQGLDAYSCPTSIVGTECSGSGNCLTFGCICELGFAGDACENVITSNGIVPFRRE